MGIPWITISLGSVANIPRAIGFFRGINKNKKQNQKTLDTIYLLSKMKNSRRSRNLISCNFYNPNSHLLWGTLTHECLFS